MMFGYAASETIGSNVSMLMPDPFRHQHDEYLNRYLKTGEKKIIGIGRETVARRKSGEVFPMELAISEAVFQGSRYFTGIIRDITARKRAESIENELVNKQSMYCTLQKQIGDRKSVV